MEKDKKAVLKESEDVKGLEVHAKGFEKSILWKNLGFQATNLGYAIDLWKTIEGKRDDITIFFGFTSNMISSGLRDIITWLVKNKKVDVIVTTAGGVEEDIIKVFKPFIIQKNAWKFKGKELREKGINRIGNILVPNDRYIAFEKHMMPFFEQLLEEREVWRVKDFIWKLGESIEKHRLHEESWVYWAYKHRIPVFSPAITDGSIGDMLYFFNKYETKKKLLFDISQDLEEINTIAVNAKETAVIILGGGLVKHHIINANLMREGADYAIYINTAIEQDGSLSGAPAEESKAWGKIKGYEDNTSEIWCDATICFPILVKEVFFKYV